MLTPGEGNLEYKKGITIITATKKAFLTGKETFSFVCIATLLFFVICAKHFFMLLSRTNYIPGEV